MNWADFHAKWNRLREDGIAASSPARSQSEKQPVGDQQPPFPTDAQLDLLKAALLPADQAAPAWRRWKARGLRFETVDQASARLCSQLWTNRDAAGIDASDLPLIKGVYRQVLSRNAVVLADALAATTVLTEAGVPVLFIKGAAMIAMADGPLGLRRITDVDVLIPEADAQRAFTLLTNAGCSAKSGLEVIGASHGVAFVSPSGCELDVHWWAFKTAGDDRGMFDTAREATLLDRRVLIPSATECLISSVANAFNPYNGAPLRWIADAMLIFQIAVDEIDWDALLERAQRPGLTLSLAGGLDYLTGEFEAPVPAYVLAELRRRRVNWRERASYRAMISNRHWAAVNEGRASWAVQIYEIHREWEHHRHYRTSWLEVPRSVASMAKSAIRAVLVRLIARGERNSSR
jgi:hypothetical protein